MKNEIICPHCGKAFKIDDTAFAEILKQVRDSEFNTELHARIEDAVNLAVAETKNETKSDVVKKDAEIVKLQARLESEITQLKSEKESAVLLAAANIKNELQNDIAIRDTEIEKLKMDKASSLESLKSDKEAEISKLKAQIDANETAKEMAIIEIKSKLEKEREELRAKLELAATEKELAVNSAVNVVEKQRDELSGKLNMKDHERMLLESSLKEKHNSELKLKDEQIAQYKDFKSKQSVKLLGESLEQHCEIVFRQMQSTGAFKNAYFEKDNDASSGGKGDYVYREVDESGNELLSIMFDMKNEADDTTVKKKNEEHFKKLDKDRIEKKCEYAVLVSVLETDSDLYSGITDVSYKYNKMYVVRPNFFIPIVTLLRNAALNSMQYKSELAIVRAQNIDVTNFENQLNDFRDSFGKSYRLASDRFKDAVDNIDKSIAQLQKTKDNLLKSEDHYRIANNKADELSVKRLTRGNPTMAAKFDSLKKD